MTKERNIERGLTRYAHASEFLCLKWVSPSIGGVPDRVLIGYNQVIFIELKAPQKKPKIQQHLRLNQIVNSHNAVYVIDSIDQIKTIIDFHKDQQIKPLPFLKRPHEQTPNDQSEKNFEQQFKQLAHQLGYHCWKFTSPGVTAVPDRILIGHGHVLFIELKGKNGKPSVQQLYRLKQLNKHGAHTYLVQNINDANQILVHYRRHKRKQPVHSDLSYQPVDIKTLLDAHTSP